MREETATIETNVHLLAHIATDLREIAAQIDELAIETASANQEEPIALPEKTEPTPERAVNQRLRYANGRRVQPTGPRFGGNAVRPGMGPRFAGGVNPLMGLFGGMAGGLGGGLGSLLGGGAGGMNPLLGLLGGAAGHTGAGTPGNVNPLASLLGGGGLGALLGGSSPLNTLLGANGGNLSSLLQDPQTLQDLLSGKISANDLLQKINQEGNKTTAQSTQPPTKEKTTPSENSVTTENPATAIKQEAVAQEQTSPTQEPQNEAPMPSRTEPAENVAETVEATTTENTTTGEDTINGPALSPNNMPFVAPQPQPVQQPYPPYQSFVPQGFYPLYQPAFQVPFWQPGAVPLGQPFFGQGPRPVSVPRQQPAPAQQPSIPAFSMSATRAIRTPTPADAQYLDALLKKWNVF